MRNLNLNEPVFPATSNGCLQQRSAGLQRAPLPFRGDAAVAFAKRRGRPSPNSSTNDAESLFQLSNAIRGAKRSAEATRRAKTAAKNRTAKFTKGFGGVSEASIAENVQERSEDFDWLQPTHEEHFADDDHDSASDADVAFLEDLTDTEVDELLGRDTSAPDALAGVDAAVEAELQSLLGEFPFTLDDFQVQAVRHLMCGRSVVVCAPTGAGKTAIAQAAASYYLRRGGRVVYTTPLKALSNQKLGEMRDRFGVDAAGLQTGDASINPGADVVVMTTEILRNILYRTAGNSSETGRQGGTPVSSEAQGSAQGEVILPESSRERLAGVRLVVLDECHWLGDPGRGSVWEECVINLPRDVQILAMSATVRNPGDLSGWIESVHGPCDKVVTSFRPVPLKWHYCLSPEQDTVSLLPLLDARGRALNPALLPLSRRFLDASSDDDSGWKRWDAGADKPEKSRSAGTAGRDRGTTRRDRNAKGRGGAPGGVSMRTLEELVGDVDGGGNDPSWHRLPRWKRVPSMELVVGELQRREMLPAIWFIFSRKDCDAAAVKLPANGMCLTDANERQEIIAELELLRQDQPEAVKERATSALLAGMAAHHAGCLPAWKSLIERLFQRGLIKVVFATETLAAGINMPARSVLISSLSRRRDSAIAALAHNELLQMAGRAGRRGYDTLGHCVIVQSRWEEAETGFDIIRRGPENLRSQFSTTYGMALNLLYYRSMSEAREFVERSFLQYLGSAGAERARNEISALESKAQSVLDVAAKRAGKAAGNAAPVQLNGGKLPVDDENTAEQDSWVRFQKLQGQRREEKRATRLLRAQLADERGAIAERWLLKAGFPRPVGLDPSGTNLDDDAHVLPALVVARLDDGPRASNLDGGTFVCLGADNNIYSVSPRHICAVFEGDNTSSRNKVGDDASVAVATSTSMNCLEEWQEAARVVISHASELRRSSWREISVGACVADGSGLTATTAATRLPHPSALTLMRPSPEGLNALKAQRERMATVKRELEVLKADGKIARASKKYAEAATRAGTLFDRAATLRNELKGRLDGGWRAFEAVVSVLEAAGALEPETDDSSSAGVDSDGDKDDANIKENAPHRDRRRFSALGLVARDLRCANELWMAVALAHPSVQILRPPQLAGVMSALVAPEAFSRSAVYVAYQPSAEVAAAVEALEPARSELAALQMRAGLDVPLAVDLRLAGVVEAWASGAGWGDVTTDCSLDDGDVARLLIRTGDALRQAGHCEHLLPTLRGSARAAARAMDRKPISDLIA